MTIDPNNLTSMTPAEFAAFVKSASDQEIKDLFGGEHRQAILDAIFNWFPAMFRPDKAEGVNSQVNWRVTGGPGDSADTYGVFVKDGQCTVAKDPETDPDVSFMTGPVEFVKLLTGAGNAVMMVMSGKVKIRGEMPQAMAFQSWFSMPRG